MVILNNADVTQLIEDLRTIRDTVDTYVKTTGGTRNDEQVQWLDRFSSRWSLKLMQLHATPAELQTLAPDDNVRDIWIHPEDTSDALRMLKSLSMTLALYEFMTITLRGKLKYGHTFETADDALEWVRETLNEELRDRDINLDELVN